MIVHNMVFHMQLSLSLWDFRTALFRHPSAYLPKDSMQQAIGKVLVNNYEWSLVLPHSLHFIFSLKVQFRYTVKERHGSSGISGINRTCELRFSNNCYKMDFLSRIMCYLWVISHESRDYNSDQTWILSFPVCFCQCTDSANTQTPRSGLIISPIDFKVECLPKIKHKEECFLKSIPLSLYISDLLNHGLKSATNQDR